MEARPTLLATVHSDPHRDTAELGLSKRQLKLFDGWKRPNELVPLLNEGAAEGPTMTCDIRTDLAQDITTDCSVVASLCALATRAERGHSRVCSKVYSRFSNLTAPRSFCAL